MTSWGVALAGAVIVFAADVRLAEATICSSGPQTITTTVIVTEPCTITGEVVIQSGGTLFVNYRGFPGHRLIISGDLHITGNGQFFFAGGVLEFQQDFRQHREITTLDQARLVVSDAEVVTSQNAESKFMYYFARGSSQAIFMNSRLDPAMNWLIAQVHDSSTLRVSGSELVPTEIYVRGKSSVSVQSSTGIGCWMELDRDSSGRIELPVQTNSIAQLVRYSFRWGRESAIVNGIEWQLDILDSSVNLGIESNPGSSFHIVGVGAPLGGELKLSYSITEGTHVFSNLGTGLVNMAIDGGRLILENIQLGLVSWQIYVRNADVLITDSVLNEVGVDSNARVRVENSVMQLAQLASLGSGSVLEISGSQMYNQGVDVMGNGRLLVENSAIYGSSFRTYDAEAVVQIIDGAFLTNPADCSFETIFDALGGIPRCNPFIPPGAAPAKSGPGTMTCVGTANCAW